MDCRRQDICTDNGMQTHTSPHIYAMTLPGEDQTPRERISRRAELSARVAITALLYAAPAVIALHGCALSVTDPDIWWHLRTGQWILEHHAFPHTDPFSSFAAGHPWQAYSWLFELLVFFLYRWLGLGGLVAYTAGMVMAIAAAVFGLIGRLQSDFTKAALLTAAVMVAMCRLDTPRPWLFTVLLFVWEMDLLMTVRRTGRWIRLFWLPPIFALWANLHIQFIDGLLLLAVAAIEPALARWLDQPAPRLRTSAWLAAGTACALATLANPYGYRIYETAYRLASQRDVFDKVSELQAMPFRSASDFLLLFLALAAAGALARSRRFSIFECALLALAAILSFRSQRDLWFMAIVAGTALAAHLPSQPRVGRSLPAYGAPLAGAAAAALVAVGTIPLHVNNTHLETLLAQTMPVRAVEFVKKGGYGGTLYNTYNWGGFLIWSLRRPDSIDGRAALDGDERIDRFDATWDGEPKWRFDPELAAAGLVIAPRKTPLSQLLRMDPRFQLAYEDSVATVFVPRRKGGKRAAGVATLGDIGHAIAPVGRRQPMIFGRSPCAC